MKVKLSDIVDAIEEMDQYSEYFLDMETGKVEWVSDMTMTHDEKEEIYNRLDEHGFCRLPTSFDIREYDIMEDFVDTLPRAQQEALSSAIQGKGAFRRFKDSVYQMGLIRNGMHFRRRHLSARQPDGAKKMI